MTTVFRNGLNRTQEVATAIGPVMECVRTGGKFLLAGGDKLLVRGVTYGTFRPGSDGDGNGFRPAVAERDLRRMAKIGVNAVRVYAVPPIWFLDLAGRHGIRVFVGIPWEQHVIDLFERRRSIGRRIQNAVRQCAGHSAVLGYAIGNEIPAGIVRWHGRRRVEHLLEALYLEAKAADPAGIVTYVNYPTTEFLDLPFLDLVAFNVYLESARSLEAYLARLHHIAGDRPLFMTELGFDSLRNGGQKQAQVLDWQLRTTFRAGCAGAFVFAWTDEWHRGGHEVDDWSFGLTGRDRTAKPALKAVRDAFAEVPFGRDKAWPPISVIVCSYNGERCIRDCLEALARVDYPDFEVIVVDDGSTDRTAEIAAGFEVRLISTENHGLSHARNVGLRAAAGDIVAYIDDDAYPDPDWLRFLASAFMRSPHAGIGGPNIPPEDDGFVADCVACAPGGPIHVLLSDEVAEHIPGCNMAFRRNELRAIGGFDTQFRVAGDDVDVCWRLQDAGHTLGFSPAAMVWHHRRASIRGYWRQQRGYGRAEALLERKWPEKYNHLGHVSWSGRLYGNGVTMPLSALRSRVYQGTWGHAPFQSIYQPAPGLLHALSLMPEWYLIILALTTLAVFSAVWAALRWVHPFLVVALLLPLAQAALSARRAVPPGGVKSRPRTLAFRLVTGALHLLQPAARLAGRLSFGLTWWRGRGQARWILPRPRRRISVWSERWSDAHDWLARVESGLRVRDIVAVRGGDFDRWDLESRVGTLGGARLLMAIEEHGGGRQFARFRAWPICTPGAAMVGTVAAVLAVAAALDQAWTVALVFGLLVLMVAVRWARQAGTALGAMGEALAELDAEMRRAERPGAPE